MPPMSTAARRLLHAGLAALAVSAVVLAAAGTDSPGGLGLLGLAIVLLVSWAFLLVGESEDRFRRRHPRG